jgi:hypothetical protein
VQRKVNKMASKKAQRTARPRVVKTVHLKALMKVPMIVKIVPTLLPSPAPAHLKVVKTSSAHLKAVKTSSAHLKAATTAVTMAHPTSTW